MSSQGKSETMTDEQLVELCLKGVATAQRALYERFASKMFGVCLRYAASREEAEDYLQEGFVKVFQHLSSYRNEGVLEGWVRRIMVNHALGRIRERKVTWESIDDELSLGEGPAIIPQMALQDLLLQIQQLPTGFRTVFNLYAIEGYSHKEIGELLGISENTSKSQYSRARAQLATKLEELNNELIKKSISSTT